MCGLSNRCSYTVGKSERIQEFFIHLFILQDMSSPGAELPKVDDDPPNDAPQNLMTGKDVVDSQ